MTSNWTTCSWTARTSRCTRAAGPNRCSPRGASPRPAKPVLVGLEAAGNEGNDAWDGFLDGLTGRGLRPPLLVISDGAAGLVGAIERGLARSLRQRCLIHRARNILAKVPTRAQDEVKAAYWAMFDIPADLEPGEKAESLVQQRITAFAVTYNTAFPAAVRALQADPSGLDRVPALPP